MKKVWIEPGCITCGSCEFRAPAVFEVTDMSHLKDNFDIEKEAENIKIAASFCPVKVIKYN